MYGDERRIPLEMFDKTVTGAFADTIPPAFPPLTIEQIREVVREEIERALDLDELLSEIRDIVHE